jgi:hypothetical protein
MQHTPIVAQDIMSPVDKRNDGMAALHKLAAKFAADQPRSSGYKYTATVSLHDTLHLSCSSVFSCSSVSRSARWFADAPRPTVARSHSKSSIVRTQMGASF